MPAFGGSLMAVWWAVLLDRLLRDPPNAVHPVAWMGNAVGLLAGRVPRTGHAVPLLGGMVLTLLGSAAMINIGMVLEWFCRWVGETHFWLVEGLVLRFFMSASGLFRAGRAVQQALDAGELATARRCVGFHLVSRPTSELSETQVAAATVESLAENTSDSVLAPLFYYALAGLPAVLLYRFVNTCDAMLGYRDQEREWLGKVPARADDVLNFIPARLTALSMLMASPFTTNRLRGAFRIWRRDRHATASPNAGHPMSAAAGVLGIELEKVDCYRLGSGQRLPNPDDISRCIRLCQRTVLLGAAVCSLLIAARQMLLGDPLDDTAPAGAHSSGIGGDATVSFLLPSGHTSTGGM